MGVTMGCYWAWGISGMQIHLYTVNTLSTRKAWTNVCAGNMINRQYLWGWTTKLNWMNFFFWRMEILRSSDHSTVVICQWATELDTGSSSSTCQPSSINNAPRENVPDMSICCNRAWIHSYSVSIDRVRQVMELVLIIELVDHISYLGKTTPRNQWGSARSLVTWISKNFNTKFKIETVNWSLRQEAWWKK